MRRKQPTKSSPTFANPEIEQIEQLFQFMTEHNLEEFEYSRGDLHIRLRKPSSGLVLAAPRAAAAPEIIVANPGGAAPTIPEASATTPAPPEARLTEELHLVKSPIVGTFYGSPSPGAEPFVKVGAFVETGQTLCIVEAMKLMNEIESDETGEIVRIFAENGQPVEYGQPLFGIRPSRKK
ncbi:MAG: acetyl-CoA carboxylase biotin carboxyl carrier protein [Acidobacteria bacterium]|nr:MAG: acetyl-CoA carboxylase biotin carboxyl carrier protein [Acidobacteriota bacterium]